MKIGGKLGVLTLVPLRTQAYAERIVVDAVRYALFFSSPLNDNGFSPRTVFCHETPCFVATITTQDGMSEKDGKQTDPSRVLPMGFLFTIQQGDAYLLRVTARATCSETAGNLRIASLTSGALTTSALGATISIPASEN